MVQIRRPREPVRRTRWLPAAKTRNTRNASLDLVIASLVCIGDRCAASSLAASILSSGHDGQPSHWERHGGSPLVPILPFRAHAHGMDASTIRQGFAESKKNKPSDLLAC